MAKTKAPALAQFGSNVRKLREAKGWTQEQLAEEAELDQTYISGVERGERHQESDSRAEAFYPSVEDDDIPNRTSRL